MAKNRKEVLAAIEAAAREWLETLKLTSEAMTLKNYEVLHQFEQIEGFEGSNNFITRQGLSHLRAAAEGLLLQEGLERQLKQSTIYRLTGKAFSDEIDKLKDGKKRDFSPNAVVDRIKSRVDKQKRVDGLYVIPALFAPKAKNSDLKIGTVRILSKEKFLAENNTALVREKESTDGGKWARSRFVADWEKYSERYDHMVMVEVSGCERDLGWKAAHEAAEFIFNLIRMALTYERTKRIKLAGGQIWEEDTSTLILHRDGSAWWSSGSGPWGSHLDDTWMDEFWGQQGGFIDVWASYAAALTRGASMATPVLERMRYAQQLIAEAYSEPHDHIRLVRTIGALEALAATDGNDIARTLAFRCALAGGWGNTVAADVISGLVAQAYRTRNKVVHGERASPMEIGRVFLELEWYLMSIVQGFAVLYAGIAHAVAPQNVSALRREVERRLPTFFWAPDLAISDAFGYRLSGE